MGFFDIFKSVPKSYSLDEAIALIAKELDSLDAARKDDLYRIALQAKSEFSLLSKLLDDFSLKQAPERAKASEKVKARFCEIAGKQISDLREPSKENPQVFLSEASSLLLTLGGLTERQILHLGVIFKDDVVPVAKKMKEINTLLEKSKSTASDHSRALLLSQRLSSLGREKHDAENTLREREPLLKSLEDRRNSFTIPREHVDSSPLLLAEKKLNIIKQEIDSLLSVQKTLKKYAHAKGVRDDLLEAYVNSPSSAIIADADLRILDYLRAASSFDDSGKVAHALNRTDYIREKRTALLESMNNFSEEKQKYDKMSEASASAAMDAKRRLSSIEFEIKECSKAMAEARETAADAARNIASTRVELCTLASRILKADVA